ncbi:glucose-6-Phosphatase isoform 1-T1 [Glossina fuscipes fuscipes]
MFSQGLLTFVQEHEICLHNMLQKYFRRAELLFLTLNKWMEPSRVLDILVPLVGAFNHQLFVRLVCSLSIINTSVSLIKWCCPEYRPYWWLKEFKAVHHFDDLQQYPSTCETSAGFPSAHSTVFTVFVHLFLGPSMSYISHQFKMDQRCLKLISSFLWIVFSSLMWLSRMYLLAEFLHQCILGSLIAFLFLHFFNRHSSFFYALNRRWLVTGVLCCSSIPVTAYFSMLSMHVDPHWSVRMAFKWCQEPSNLCHETSPVFSLGRDFGYLMGVALSAPLFKRHECSNSRIKRLPLMISVEIINYWARLETPKTRGRFIFVAYECLRNLLHSFTLLTILPKLIT